MYVCILLHVAQIRASCNTPVYKDQRCTLGSVTAREQLCVVPGKNSTKATAQLQPGYSRCTLPA